MHFTVLSGALVERLLCLPYALYQSTHGRPYDTLLASVIFVLIYFLVLVLVFQLFFTFSFVLVFIIFSF